MLKSITKEYGSYDTKALVAAKKLWELRSIQNMYSLRNRTFHMLDSLPYFMSEIDRIAQQDYVPNERDVLQLRQKTVGVIPKEYTLRSSCNLTYVYS